MVSSPAPHATAARASSCDPTAIAARCAAPAPSLRSMPFPQRDPAAAPRHAAPASTPISAPTTSPSSVRARA